jgi:hypothetical protein
MAAYQDLYNLFNNASLRNKMAVAVIVAAEKIRTEDAGTTNHAARLTWAKAAFQNPEAAAVSMLKAILAANNTLTVEQITDATDAAIQTKVDAAVDVFADGA